MCKQKAGGGSMVHVSVTRSQLGARGELVAGATLTTWVHLVAWGEHS